MHLDDLRVEARAEELRRALREEEERVDALAEVRREDRRDAPAELAPGRLGRLVEPGRAAHQRHRRGAARS